jgi:hypothetical protein
VTELELQAAVLDLCHLYRLWAYHPHDSRRSEPGWPDLVILGKTALFAELKSADGRRSIAQIKVAGRIAGAGLVYRLWRPADLADGTIVKELEAIR